MGCMIWYKDSGWSYDFEYYITMKQPVNETSLRTKTRIYTVCIVVQRQDLSTFFTKLEQFGSFLVHLIWFELDETLIRNDYHQSEHTIIIGADLAL